jgi:hypothetical protein
MYIYEIINTIIIMKRSEKHLENKIKQLKTPFSISLRVDQIAFIKNQIRTFNFSKFVRAKLDEYIEMIRKVKLKNG